MTYSKGTIFEPVSKFRLRLKFVMSVILFRVIIDSGYILFVYPTFNDYYIRAMTLDFGFFRYTFSFFILAAICLFCPYGKKDFSGVLYLSVIIFLIVPITSLFGLDKNIPLLSMAIVCMSVGVSLLFSESVRVRFEVKMPRNGERTVIFISVLCCAIFLIISAVSGALQNIQFDLSDVYSIREEQSELLDIGVLAYFNIWTQKIFNPILLIIGLYKRSWIVIFVSLALQLYFFGITQHRAHVVAPILIFMIMRLYASDITLPRVVLYASFAVAGVIAVSLIFGLYELPAITIRRAFFVPASITLDWIEFFQHENKVYWSDKILSGVIVSNYNEELLPWYVGKQFTGQVLAYNSGLIGAGFAQAGYLGVILYSALVGIIVQFVNAMIRGGLPTFMAAAILIAPMRTAWADADLFTAFLSHGIVIGIIVLWMYGRAETQTIGNAASTAHRRLANRPISAARASIT